MEILLDTVDLKKIETLVNYMPIDGVTTNPSILSKGTDDVKATFDRLKEILGDKMIHAQVTGSDYKTMFEQAKTMKEYIGPSFFVKIPMTLDGIKAVQMCKKAGINVTVTAIFTAAQALIAAKAGADYVAPYVNRLDNITSDGSSVVGEIVNLFERYNYKTKVLAASFKNVQQVLNVASLGAHAATVNAELCEKMLWHPYTDKSLIDFDNDWRNKFGEKEVSDLFV